MKTLTTIALLALSSAALAADKSDDLIKTQSDTIAAGRCQARHYSYMVRLSPEYVLCLTSDVGGPASVVAVAAVLQRKVQ